MQLFSFNNCHIVDKPHKKTDKKKTVCSFTFTPCLFVTINLLYILLFQLVIYIIVICFLSNFTIPWKMCCACAIHWVTQNEEKVASCTIGIRIAEHNMIQILKKNRLAKLQSINEVPSAFWYFKDMNFEDSFFANSLIVFVTSVTSTDICTWT